MIIEIPFTYDADVAHGRGTRTWSHVVRDVVTVDVPEVAADDAPCAYEVTSHRAWDHGNVVPHRIHEGRPYQPVTGTGSRMDGARFREVMARHASGTDAPMMGDGGVDPTRVPKGEGIRSALNWGSVGKDLASVLHAPGLRRGRVVTDTRAARLAEAHRDFPGRLLVVDGTVWSRQGVREPVVVLELGGGGGPRLAVRDGQPSASWDRCVFRLDQWDEALGLAEDVARRRGRPSSVGVPPIVHRPDLVGHDQRSGVLDQLLDGMARARDSAHRMGRLAVAFEVAFATFDGHLAVEGDDRDDRWVEDAMAEGARLRSLLASVPEFREAASLLEPALDGWERIPTQALDDVSTFVP